MSANATAAVIPMAQELHIKRILYATDFSQASLSALPVASALAKRFDATLCIAHVWSALPARMLSTVAAVSAYDSLQEAAATQMHSLLADQCPTCLKTETFIAEGDPLDRIIPMISEADIDLIVVGTEGKGGFKRFALGSVAENICRTATCPVITVGPNVDKRFSHAETIKSILCPVDMSGQSAEILPLVAGVASEFDSSVTLLHVLPPSMAEKDLAGGVTRRLRQEMQNLCRQHVSPCRASECRVEFGGAVESILSVSQQVNADVIALGIRPALPIGLRFQDTVTYKVMSSAKCPVLTYRSQWWK